MDYLNQYLDFYSGNNRKEIYKQFCSLIEAIRTDNYNQFDQLFSSNCIVDVSMTGHGTGISQVINLLKWPGPEMDIRKITIWNFVSRSHNDIAQQSAYVQCIFAKEDEHNVYPFVFGGHFVNSYIKENGRWKIKHLKFDLMYEFGNNSYVKDKWILMDYGIFYGHKPMINAEIDSPWHVIPIDDEPQTDVEQIFECEFKLNFAMDGGDFELLESTFSKDVRFIMSAHKNVNKYNTSQTDSDYYGAAACSNFLKSKHHKEPRLQHTDTMGDIVIEGNYATAYMFRSEFNRIANQIYTKENIHSNVNTVLHKNKFIKENGEWKLLEFNYKPVLDFVNVDDDCLRYDDYICGGTKWSIIEK
ncbi:MAG: nuclear transport factor 2 family protein [Eubacterium sp.]